jgi:hypothetical protein
MFCLFAVDNTKGVISRNATEKNKGREIINPMIINANGNLFGPKIFTKESVITMLALLLAINFPIIDPKIIIEMMAPSVEPIPF